MLGLHTEKRHLNDTEEYRYPANLSENKTTGISGPTRICREWIRVGPCTLEVKAIGAA
jgi:hypothetical protein